MRSITTLAAIALVAVTATDVRAQDPGADPTYGAITLQAGFEPDPHEIDLTAGGSVGINRGSCNYGNVAGAPDVDLHYEAGGGNTLYIYVISSDDTTLLVNTPNSSWRCDDDSFGDGDPILVIPKAPSGLYDIWVGTYGEEMISATLYISEIDPRQSPAAHR